MSSAQQQTGEPPVVERLGDGPPRATGSGIWWNIKLGHPFGDVASDDLTLDEVERIETLTEVPWALGNPLAALRQAKAWLLVALLHAGASEEDATGRVGRASLRTIKGAFQLHAGDAPPPPGDELPPAPPT